MAASYERVNYLTSFGFSLRWRKQFIRAMPSAKNKIMAADLMTGLGENWQFIKKHNQQAEITAIDFSEGMLKIAAKRNKKNYNQEIRIVNADVLESPFPDETFDLIVCAFGLKTLNQQQVKKLAEETFRLLKPGGRYSFIEVSVPTNIFLKKLYLFYLEHIIPLIGRLFLGNPAQYKMLSFYTREFNNAEKAFGLFKAAGLAPYYKKYFKGCATGFSGQKL